MGCSNREMPGNVDEFIAALDPAQRELVDGLRQLIKRAAPKIHESIKWKMPCFEQDGLVCAIMAAKKHVSLGFYKGARLSDPDGLLEGTGTKLRHIKVRTPKHIHKAQFTGWIKQAVRLNAEY